MTQNRANLVENLTLDAYVQAPGYSRSALQDLLVQGPEYFAGRYITGTIPGKQVTKQMDFGTVVDRFLTEGIAPSTEAPDGVIVAPAECLKSNGDRNTRGAEWKQLVAENPDAEIWTPRELERFQTEQEAVRAICHKIKVNIEQHEAARRLLLDGDGVNQPSILFDWLGLPLKSRPDRINYSAGVIVDLKMSESIQPQTFVRKIERFGYDLQAVIAQLGFAAACDEGQWPVVNIVVRDSEPYDVRVFEYGREFLDRGNKRLIEAIYTIHECQKSGRWRADDWGKVTTIEPARWMRYDDWSITEERAAEEAAA